MGGQGGCDRRIEVFGIIHTQKIRGVGLGGSGWGGVRVGGGGRGGRFGGGSGRGGGQGICE